MKIIIEEIRVVELVDKGWIKPLYKVETEEPEKLIEGQRLEGLEAKLVVKFVKRVLKEEQKRRNIGEARFAGYGEKPDTARPEPAPRPLKKFIKED